MNFRTGVHFEQVGHVLSTRIVETLSLQFSIKMKMVKGSTLRWFRNFDAGIVAYPPVHEEVAANHKLKQ
jgi:hypothetical protein